MPGVFFVADLHLGHSHILTYEAKARPFDGIDRHDRGLVEAWNAVVGEKDLVWILGDFAWSRERADWALKRLNGRKKLVLGDHDARWFDACDHGPHFERVGGVEKWKHGIALCHAPILVGEGKYVRCIHGHTHSHRVPDPADGDAESPQYACVSVEHTGLAPISWENLAKRKGW